MPRDGSSAGIWYRNDENVSAILTGVAPSAVNDAPPSVDLATNRVVSLRTTRTPARQSGLSGVAEQKFRRFENTHQRLGPKTGLKTASTRPPKGAETLSGSASL